MADLVKSGVEGRVEPQVLTRASPESYDLLQARADIQGSPELQSLFRQARAEEWAPGELARQLAVELRRLWPAGTNDPGEAAQFLEDEYTQVGPTGIQLVSTVTGRIAAILKEDDIYTPAPLPREGSDQLAQPLARIRPDVESALVTWFHDRGREANILEALAKRGHQTALLREMGDPRLLVATRRGRQHIVESLSQFDPKALLEAAGGTAGAFLKLFELEEPELRGHTSIEGTVSSRTSMGIQDPLTTNLHHNRPATLRSVLVQGWIRDMARQLSLAAHQRSSATLKLDVLSATVLPGQFWIVPPDMVRPLHRIDRKALVLPVEGASPVLVREIGQRIGYLRIPDVFEARNLERFNRWEVATALDYKMWVDFTYVFPVSVEGVEVSVQVL